MKKILILAAAAAALSLASCKEAKKTTEQAANAATEAVQQAANAATEAAQKLEDFTTNLGTYEGTIAQADGAGYATTLTFNPDFTYNCTMVADAGTGTVIEEKGTFVFDVTTQKLTLTDGTDANKKYILEVDGNKLILCDAEGNLPENKDMYTLTHK